MGFIIGLFSLSFISAETLGEAALRNTGSGIKALFDALYLNPDNSTKILLGILLYIVIYSVVVQIFGTEKSKGGKLFAAIFSLIVVLLSFIALPQNFIETIVLQYGAMGAAILTIIPFIILLYFSLAVTSSLFIARAVWIFYIFYYISLFGYKIISLPAGTSTGEWFPYLAAILAGIVIMLFIPGIRGLIFKGKLDELEEKGEKVAGRAKVLHKLQSKELESSYGEA